MQGSLIIVTLELRVQRSKSDLGWTCSIDLFSLAGKISATENTRDSRVAIINISLLLTGYQEFSRMMKSIKNSM